MNQPNQPNQPAITTRFAMYDMTRDKLRDEIKDWLYNNLVSGIVWDDNGEKKDLHELILFTKKHAVENSDIRIDMNVEQTKEGIIFTLKAIVL